MLKNRRYTWLTVLMLWSGLARGGVFTLPQLDTTQTDPIFRTLSSALFYKPVEPASGWGKIWGVTLGVSVNGTSTAAVNSIFGGMSTPFMPAADTHIGITIPAGITLEGSYLPTMSYQSTSFQKYAMGLKWTLSRSMFSKSPVDIALRGSYSNATLNYSQPLMGGTVAVAYSSGTLSTELLFSKSFIVLEPFAGVGLLKTDSSLSGVGTANLFGASFPVGTTSVTSTQFALWLHAGAVLNLSILRLAGSFDYVAGLTSWTAKISLAI